MEGTNAVEEKDTYIYNDKKRSLRQEKPLLPEKASPVGTQETSNVSTSKSSPLKSATITKIVNVPLEMRKYKELREQTKVCWSIMKKTGAQLELSVSKQQGLFISVSGTLDSVMKAIKEIVSQMHIQDSETFEIPKENHRFVIGKNGTMLRELELKTATKIQIPGREEPSNQITITGTKEALEKAKHEILLISAKQAIKENVSQMHIKDSETFEIPKENHRFVIGKNGTMLRELELKTATKIQIPGREDPSNQITITGTKEAQEKAKHEILLISAKQDSETFEIPKENHRFVIGKNGTMLRELELKTATKIQIPGREDPSNQITIIGTKEDLEKAKHEILLISAKQDKHVVRRVNIDKVFHPFITGANNHLVKLMVQETGACIYVPPRNNNDTKICITGERKQVVLAMAKINEIFEDKKKNTTTIAVKVEKSHHKYVIGPRGQTVQDIFLKTGVSVEIPPYDSSSDTVILRGERGRLDEARTAVFAAFVEAHSLTI